MTDSPPEKDSMMTDPPQITLTPAQTLPSRPKQGPLRRPPVTIDTIARAFYNTLLHPFVAWTLPIIARAQGIAYEDPRFILVAVYAACVTLFRILLALNTRLAFGAARPIDWDDEVVLITGGGSGLGLLLAEVYALKGVPVAIVDVKSKEEVARAAGALLERDDVGYYCADVGDVEEVERLKETVVEELGTPTILINCAALAPLEPFYNPAPSSPDTTTVAPTPPSRTTKTYAANILSNHHTIRAFLPGMLASPNGGTIVTVSSVLGTLGCAALPAYSATKAAQTALHHSLAAELRMLAANTKTNVKTAAPTTASLCPGRVKPILVTLGQLDTRLFAAVRSPSWFWGPTVDVSDAAKAICAVVDAGLGGEVALPLYAGYVGVLGALPAAVRRGVRWWSGLDEAGWGAWVGSLK